MGKIINLTQQVFGRLTVVKFSRCSKQGALWECLCLCGNVIEVPCKDLRNNHTQSCGCLRNERLLASNITHNLSGHPLYVTWVGIQSRCYMQSDPDYNNWGGRGINMCHSWLSDFKQFVEYLSSLPNYGKVGRTLDRIDNNGNYEPGNVRWATKQQQNRNRRDNKVIMYRGKSQCVAAWAEELGLNLSTVYMRLRRYGNNAELAFSAFPLRAA